MSFQMLVMLNCAATDRPPDPIHRAVTPLFFFVKFLQDFPKKKQLCSSFLLPDGKDVHMRPCCCSFR